MTKTEICSIHMLCPLAEATGSLYCDFHCDFVLQTSLNYPWKPTLKASRKHFFQRLQWHLRASSAQPVCTLLAVLGLSVFILVGCCRQILTMLVLLIKGICSLMRQRQFLFFFRVPGGFLLNIQFVQTSLMDQLIWLLLPPLFFYFIESWGLGLAVGFPDQLNW